MLMCVNLRVRAICASARAAAVAAQCQAAGWRRSVTSGRARLVCAALLPQLLVHYCAPTFSGLRLRTSGLSYCLLVSYER